MAGLKAYIRRIVAAGTMSAVVSSASGACMTPAELKADQIRFMDMQLRVAALRCRFENPKFTGLYNAFVRKHRGAIQQSRFPVEGYLARLTTLSMDRYVTRTANRISHKSMATGNFCALNAAVARLAVVEADPLSLIDLLPVSYEASHQVCRVTSPVDQVTADAGMPVSASIRP